MIIKPDRSILSRQTATEAATLLRRLCASEPVPPLVVTTDMNRPLPPPIYDIAAMTRRVSARCANTEFEYGPVLAWHPDAVALDLAWRLAEGSILMVVSVCGDSDLDAWCAAAGGLDHLGKPIAVAPAVWDAIDQLRSWSAIGRASGWDGATWLELRACIALASQSWPLTATETTCVALACGLSLRDARRVSSLTTRNVKSQLLSDNGRGRDVGSTYG